MENFELIISAPPKREHNWFHPGHVPFNKGLKWTDYMDMRKANRIKKNLEIGRHLGNKHLPGANRKEIVGIKDGKLIAFDSAVNAAKILKARGIRISQRNINSVCHKKLVVNGKYTYQRKRAGGYQWFFSEDIESYKNLIK
jgi:hypothetical protein